MRAYKVTTTPKLFGLEDDVAVGEHTVTLFAGTQALAKTARRTFMNDHGVKMADVTIEEVEVPTSKGALLDFINGLLS